MKRATAADAAIAAATVGLGAALWRGSRGRPGPAALASVLVGLSLPALRREAARERDPRLLWVLLAAEGSRLAGALIVRNAMHRLYGEGNDADDYHRAGTEIAPVLRHGRLREAVAMARHVPFDTAQPLPLGTNLVRLLNAGVYVVAGPSQRNGSVVFSWLGFWGLVLLRRAFVVGLPAGRREQYTAMLFLTPSLGFFSSMIGKEAWTLLGMGTWALGGARALAGRRGRGLLLLTAGGAMVVAGRPTLPALYGRRFAWAVRDSAERSAIGGSRFSVPAWSLRSAPVIAGTVLFRPHPLEARNAVMLAAATESAVLAALGGARAGTVLRALGGVRRNPYLGLAVGAIAVFVPILSGVANFGILVRQRTAVLPFYLALLAARPRPR